MRLAFLLVFCLSLIDVKNEGCRVWCLSKKGVTGVSMAPGCMCQEVVKTPYEDLIHNRVNLGSSDLRETDEPVAPFRSDFKAGTLHVNPWGYDDRQ